MELTNEKDGESAPKIEAVRGKKKRDVSADGGAYIVAAPTGGQGATLTVELLALALTQAGLKPQLAAAGATKYLPNDSTQLASTGALTQFDPIGDLMMEPASLIDIATNSIEKFLDWARISHASDIIGPEASITLVIPLTAQVFAAHVAFSLVQRVRLEENKGGLRFSRIAIVVNDRNVEVLQIAEIAEIVSAMQQQLGVCVATMPRARI